MISKEDYIRAWESRVGARSVHLDERFFNINDLNILHNQYDMVLNNIDFNNKTVIDLGCGGGMFGNYLFRKEKGIKKYIGIDIARRCIDEARLNNICWDGKAEIDFICMDPIDLMDLRKIKANILVVLNVIRFLPDQEYVEKFMEMISGSNIKYLFFNFRLGESNTFREKPYKTTNDIGQANRLKKEFILQYFEKYDIKKMSNTNDNCYVFLGRKRKKVTTEEENKKIETTEAKDNDIVLSG